MAQITLGALSTLNTSTHLDPMFTEIYGALTFGSGGRVGVGAAPGVGYKLDVSGTIRGIGGALSASGYGLRLTNSDNTGAGSLTAPEGASAGMVVSADGGPLTLVAGGGTVMVLNNTSHVEAGADNAKTLGTASKRWSTVYAGTGSINTSDEREKTTISPLSAAELAASKRLAAEIGTYHWLEAVQAKGSDARTHVGLTVQRAIEILGDEGLDATAYGFICYDSWEQSGDTPAGDRYSFRTDELLLFIARGFDARLAALEA